MMKYKVLTTNDELYVICGNNIPADVAEFKSSII